MLQGGGSTQSVGCNDGLRIAAIAVNLTTLVMVKIIIKSDCRRNNTHSDAWRVDCFLHYRVARGG